MTTATSGVDGRSERRLVAMRRVQEVALHLFESKGLAAVTVEDIAARAKVGAASVYRNFGSKEGVVLWDDYDPALLAEVQTQLLAQPPLQAMRDAVLSRLSAVYREDRPRILRRTRLILAEPSLLAANAAQLEGFRAALAQVFAPGRSALEADVLAIIAVGVLGACVREWARKDGRVAMSRVVKSGFDLALATQVSTGSARVNR
jgi:AcrR family transcriptional regulator